VQAYAPLPQLPDRVVLLFGCTKAGCGKSPGCWRALRCQQPAHKPQPQQQQQQQQQEDSTSSSQQQPQSAKHVSPAATGFDAVAADGNWGFGDASGGLGGWDLGQTTGATSSSTNAFDFSDLAESLSAVVQQQQDHHHHHQQQQQQQQKQQQQREQQAEAAIAGAGATAASSKGTAGPALPEFYLYAEVEPGEVSAVVC
jgi:ABC-type nickel/cobalt efflux system permease component RcnA